MIRMSKMMMRVMAVIIFVAASALPAIAQNDTEEYPPEVIKAFYRKIILDPIALTVIHTGSCRMEAGLSIRRKPSVPLPMKRTASIMKSPPLLMKPRLRTAAIR